MCNSCDTTQINIVFATRAAEFKKRPIGENRACGGLVAVGYDAVTLVFVA
jgi:hypothetical protein